MNRRRFLVGSAAVAGTMAAGRKLSGLQESSLPAGGLGLDPGRHRFGVNYTPSHNWWFCWND